MRWPTAARARCETAPINSRFFISLQQLKLDLAEKATGGFLYTMNLMPIVAVFGSFMAGWVSDKFFKGRRSPVAMTLYYFESLVILWSRPW